MDGGWGYPAVVEVPYYDPSMAMMDPSMMDPSAMDPSMMDADATGYQEIVGSEEIVGYEEIVGQAPPGYPMYQTGFVPDYEMAGYETGFMPDYEMGFMPDYEMGFMPDYEMGFMPDYEMGYHGTGFDLFHTLQDAVQLPGRVAAEVAELPGQVASQAIRGVEGLVHGGQPQYGQPQYGPPGPQWDRRGLGAPRRDWRLDHPQAPQVRDWRDHGRFPQAPRLQGAPPPPRW